MVRLQVTQNFNNSLFTLSSFMTFQPPIFFYQPSLNLQNQQRQHQNEEGEKSREEEVKKEEQDQEIRAQITKKENLSHFDQNQTRKTPEEVPESKHIQKRKKEIDSFTEKRNIIPNNINHILSFVQRKSKSETLTQKIIAKLGGQDKHTLKRFYCYQSFIKQQLHIHVNRETLKDIINHLDLNQSIFSVEQQLFFNRVSRILIFHYLRNLAKLKILSSDRIKLTSKLDHLHAQRFLIDYMRVLSEQ